MGPVKKKPNEKSWLIYGPPGSGKTRLAASAVEVKELGPVLHIDFEAGTSSIENLYNEDDPLTIVRPGDWDDANAVFAALLDEDHGYQTVIIDTVGKMMEFLEPVLARKYADDGFAKWRVLAEKTLGIIEDLHKTHLNVIVLGHSDSEKDELRGGINTMPYFLGKKTGKDAPKIFDVIAYLYVEDTEDGPMRVLQTEGTKGTIAKDRTDTIPAYLGNPTYTKIYNYVASGVTGKGETTTNEENN